MRCLTPMPMELQCMATREKAALLTLMPMNSVAAREDRGLRVRCLTWMSVSGSDSQGRGCII